MIVYGIDAETKSNEFSKHIWRHPDYLAYCAQDSQHVGDNHSSPKCVVFPGDGNFSIDVIQEAFLHCCPFF